MSGTIPKIGYYSVGVFYDLIRFNPDIIILGGFMNWHWLILNYAKLFKKKVIFMSESLRYVKNDYEDSDTLMTQENSKAVLRKIRRTFDGADLYLGMGAKAESQFIKEIGFEREKVSWTSYPQDIEAYYKHPLRSEKKQKNYKILFANRLIDRYQPLFALEVFLEINSKYPNTELIMNSEGPLKSKCIQYIKDKKMKNVSFLEGIDAWDNMHLIYKNADILILPATYSNGNGTIIEASASGMGVVISNKINNMEKHSIDKENCFICDLNVGSFVTAISTYINNPKLFIDHGVLSRKLVEGSRNQSLAKKYFELIESYCS
ncbi:glycosyltransferase [Sporosarcina sp. CAU 1771]